MAARRLAPVDLRELMSTAATVEVARAGVYKRTRPETLVVPTEGPSWQQVAMIIATVLIGAGVLGLPYALRRAGWSALLLIVGSTVVASYTAKMLVEAGIVLLSQSGAPRRACTQSQRHMTAPCITCASCDCASPDCSA